MIVGAALKSPVRNAASGMWAREVRPLMWGAAVLFVSHRLDEVFALCQRVTIMRDGETIGAYPIDELTVRVQAGRGVIALATGSYLGEDDIVRIEDVYKRA